MRSSLFIQNKKFYFSCLRQDILKPEISGLTISYFFGIAYIKNYNDEKISGQIDHKENFLKILTVFLKCY